MAKRIKTPRKTIYKNIRHFVEEWKPETLPVSMHSVIADFYKSGTIAYIDPDELFQALAGCDYIVNRVTGVVGLGKEWKRVPNDPASLDNPDSLL
jgi:hypothetical protein